MKMLFKGREIVNISRDFLDTNGVKQVVTAEIDDSVPHYFDVAEQSFRSGLIQSLADLNVCSKKGLSEMFDSTIGARTVFMPFGGKTQLTPAIAMAAKICGGETDVCDRIRLWLLLEVDERKPFYGGNLQYRHIGRKADRCGL